MPTAIQDTIFERTPGCSLYTPYSSLVSLLGPLFLETPMSVQRGSAAGTCRVAGMDSAREPFQEGPNTRAGMTGASPRKTSTV